MTINPFLAGILATLFTEMAVVFISLFIHMMKGKKKA